jgi:hypothetical protein
MAPRRGFERAIAGRGFKALFTKSGPGRYGCIMLVLASAAAVLMSPPVARGPTAATAQARAIIRIVSGTRLRLGQMTATDDAPAARDTFVRTQGPVLQPAKLIEFE